jgi:signal peptidase I
MSEARATVAEAPEAEREANWFRDELPSLLVAIGVALAIRTFVFQTFYVPSESMLPALLIGDHVFVNKFVYGAQVPGVEWRFPAVREPERGEVVVFRFARGPNGDLYPPDADPSLPTDNFVKRLVGVPGDRIAFENGRLVLNGEPVPLEKTSLTYASEEDARRGIAPRDVWIETLGSCRHFVLDDPAYDPARNVPEFTVPEGRYLFMGDNRDNSRDGRWAGTVPKSALAGPAGLNYWSWNWNGSWLSLLNPLTWWDNLTAKMRWERMGSFVECFPDGETPELVGAVIAE